MIIFVVLVVSTCASGTVFINEAFLNPPGGTEFDAVREFIELSGTPGMKLDGYAVAILNGSGAKYYPTGSIPSGPAEGPEIDEFFSLDGLTLGDNGVLALLVTNPAFDRYPEFNSSTTDAHWVNWNGLWNGGIDAPGTINNDGSTTIMLIRNRPGVTEADPSNADGLLWGKTINHDVLLVSNAYYDAVLGWMDQWGDGHIDIGDEDGMGGYSQDMTGLMSGDISNDLEVVDEVSFEDDAGHEYDTDDRHVDFDSTDTGFPHRHVHALDNPIGFNPDALTRVDYRTKGDGWAPATDGVGEMSSGNNWMDMATEQWIRGGSEGPTGFPPHFYYDVDSEASNPIQPYETNVPLWLDDGFGDDFDFGTASYGIIAGYTNPLCIPFIPGDVDRDGDCDSDDIAKMKTVFGNDDWIFSNSFEGSPEGSEVDPNSQTKPWDLDGTGDNGIEASDMQWVLNFQGDTTGHINGIRYDSSTGASDGVVLNSNAGTECTISLVVNVPSGRDVNEVLVGDFIEVIVRGMVNAGANTTAGQENGIMQYVHDVEISSGGVVEVLSVEAMGAFDKTNESLESYQGANGDLGVYSVNGYTTSFMEGLGAPAALYKVTMIVVGDGEVDIDILPASEAKFASSTPEGLKIGHTDNNGDPESSNHIASFAVTVYTPVGDLDGDLDVDYEDFVVLSMCWLSGVGDANWNTDCDINIMPDNFIDVYDLMVFAEYWLEGTGL